MKKIHLFALVVIVIVAFAITDFWLNYKGGSDARRRETETVTQGVSPFSNMTQRIISKTDVLKGYRVIKRSRTQHLFEKVGFDPTDPVAIFYNLLEGENGEAMEIYEAHGALNQGNLTYFSIKQKFLTSAQDATATINEVSTYGHNSFFYNDINYPNTGFLVTQIGSNVYGFKYAKEPTGTFLRIKGAIDYLMREEV